MAFEFDVTVSVWNDFWAPELCAGLARSGLRVLALRNEHGPISGVRSESCEIPRILTRLYTRTQWPPLLEGAQNLFESFAKKRVGRSSVFWGWNGHNLSAFEAAKSAGQRIVCERGSTHAAWAARRLSAVHKDLGWGEMKMTVHPRDLRAAKEYELAEKIVVPSRFVKRTFLEEGVSEDRLQRNPYGVDVDRWSKIRGSKRSDGPLVFVYTASITPRKGAHILLRAWEKAALRDAELWLCGGVHLPIKELGLPVCENVKFLGFTQHNKLEEIYNRASIYVLPSFEEGMARSGLEAMAAGLPLIITEETGLTDVMTPGRHGWVVPSGEVDALADTLREAAAARGRLPQISADTQAVGLTFSKEAYGDRAAEFAKTLFSTTDFSR
jgi:glycosyltransferase involved in cell wall biosynthesis